MDTAHRGPLLIHASGNYDHAAAAWLAEMGIDHLNAEEAPRSMLLGTVDLVNVVEYRPGASRQATLGDQFDDHNLADDPLATGPNCWIVADPQPMAEPIPAKGKLSLWEYDLPEAAAAGLFRRGSA